jgi:tetratricopeptide (TPR) repeat protein
MNRPSMASRPSGGSRPNVSRPGGAGGIGGFSPSGSRPSTRPSLPSRPSTGVSQRPSTPRPGAGAGGIANRPSISRPGDLRPATRPSLPGAGGGGIQRPGAGIGDIGGRPGGINRPGGDIGRPGGDIGRPGGINRPGGDIGRPGGIANRPGAGGGGIQRPTLPDRPSIGDITRPGQGGGGIQRPGIDDIGRPGRPGDRPIIGDRDNNFINNRRRDNIHIGDNNLINRDININNIGNVNRPGWGLNNNIGGDFWSQHHDWNNWHDNWHDNCIPHHHHGWYNGCWNGNWGSNWWAPVGWATAGWGLANYGYGYGSSYSEPYYNPYYVESAAPAYDYSQPVVVNYVSSDASGGSAAGGAAQAQPPAASSDNDQAMALFDEGMAAFKAGRYSEALVKYEAALRLMPSDPVLHEVRALTLFALGKYNEAAAGLNALLASAPGMDWTSMSQLWGSTDEYTAALRTLEAHIKANRNDTAAMFVLAYHYLVIGQNDQAIKALREVVRLQPKDATAQRMLAALAPPEEKPAPEPTPAPAAAPSGPTTDLVGTWKAQAGDTVIELTIDDKSQFTWKATPKGKPPVELKGTVATDGDVLALENEKQGNMVGQVKSGGPDKFTFALQGSPPEAGLAFARAS